MKQHAKRASWARVLLVPTLLLGSASMAAFPVHAAQVELNQTVTLQMRKVKLADVFKKLSNLSGYEFSMMRVLSKSIIRLILIWTM